MKDLQAVQLNNPKQTADLLKYNTERDLNEDIFSHSFFPLEHLPTIIGSYGSKIDLVLKHLLCLKQKEPGTKSIVFSQWDSVLHIVETGLKALNMKHSKFGCKKMGLDAATSFRQDPSTNIMLFNLRSQSSGLTLVCATHVFLIEPSINHALEMQAFSRVHRIGQKSQTYVHRYIVPDTLEETVFTQGHTILNNSRSSIHRMAKYGKEGEEVDDDDLEMLLSMGRSQQIF